MIVIFVDDRSWSAAPLHGGILSERDRFLISELKLCGGIDESVPPGIYYFDIRPNQLGVDQAILQPAPGFRK